MRNILLLLILISLSILNGQQEQEYFLRGSNVTDIAQHGDEIWIATNGSGIFKFSIGKNKWEQYSTSNGNLQHDFFYCITVNNDFVWAGSIDGLFTLDKKRNNWSKRKFGLGGQLSNWIRSLAYDKWENVVWIGRFQYLTKYDINSKKFNDYDLTIRGNQKTNTIKTIKVDGDSVVWFGTEAGLHKYNKKRNLNYSDAITFFDNRYNYFNGEGEQVSISALLIERNNLWIGLDEFITPERPQFNIGGLFKYNKKNDWLRFDDSKGLTGNGINALEITGNYIWAGLYQFGKSTKEAYGRGLVLINRINNNVIPITDESISKAINTIFFDGTFLWIGTENGLIKLNFFNKLAQWNTGAK
ncbi:MAG: hypothetical protein FJ214_02615 [Ignavibacteria bacterium]|nr:hypothetical protein [Ignavibacteria bacterium]